MRGKEIAMSEKWSERHLRDQKVDALKKRMCKEIHERILGRLDAFCEFYPKMKDSGTARQFMDEMHNLYVMEDFFRDKETLHKVNWLEGELDLVSYVVDCDTLDWMLQNKNLLLTILFYVENTGLYAEEVLSDKFLNLEVFSVIDRALWSQRTEAGQEKTVSELIGAAAERSEATQDTGANRSKDACVMEQSF